jgi:hypothetical protein
MTGSALKLGVAGAFVLAACLSQSSQAGSAKPRLLIKGVGSWKFVAGGLVRVVHKDRGIVFIDPKNGAIKKAEDAGAPGTEMPAGRRYQVVHEQGKIVILGRRPGAVVRQVRQEKGRIAGTYRVNARTLGYEVQGKNFTILDLESGKATVCVSGAGNYKAFAMKPGRPWFMVMAIRMAPRIDFEFYKVSASTGKATRVYHTADDFGVEKHKVTKDGKTLVVHTESEKPGLLIRRTVDLASRKVKVKRVPRARQVQSYPLADGKGAVVEEKDSLFLVRGSERKDLFPGPGRAWAQPNTAKSPRWLRVQHLVDSTGDGRIAREDGDWVEMWILDLRTLKKKRLADTARENIGRDWSDDGKYLIYNRIRKSKKVADGSIGDLMLYDAAAGKQHMIQPTEGASYASVKGWVASDQLFVNHCTFDTRRTIGVRFTLQDLRSGRSVTLFKGDYYWTANKVGHWWIFEERTFSGKTCSLYSWRPPATAEKRP